jgi:hypothetical protein
MIAFPPGGMATSSTSAMSGRGAGMDGLASFWLVSAEF